MRTPRTRSLLSVTKFEATNRNLSKDFEVNGKLASSHDSKVTYFLHNTQNKNL